MKDYGDDGNDYDDDYGGLYGDEDDAFNNAIHGGFGDFDVEAFGND